MTMETLTMEPRAGAPTPTADGSSWSKARSGIQASSSRRIARAQGQPT